MGRVATSLYMPDKGEAARKWLCENAGVQIEAGERWGENVTAAVVCKLAKGVAGWPGDASWDGTSAPPKKAIVDALKALRERSGGFNSASMLVATDIDKKAPQPLVAALQVQYWMKTLDPLVDDGNTLPKPEKKVRLVKPGTTGRAKGQAAKRPRPPSMTMRRIDLRSVKYLESQREMARWIGKVLDDEAFEAESAAGSQFCDKLADGQVLGQLMNALKGGSVRGVHKDPSKHQFKVENVMLVARAFRDELSVPEVSLFEPTDLVDGKNMPKVVLSLGYVADAAHSKGLTAHKLHRPKPNDVPDAATFSVEQIEEARKDLDSSGLKGKFGGDEERRASLASAFSN